MASPRLGGWVARIGLVLVLFTIVGCALLPDLRPRVAEADAIAIARNAAPDLFRDEPVRSVMLVPYREVGSASRRSSAPSLPGRSSWSGS